MFTGSRSRSVHPYAGPVVGGSLGLLVAGALIADAVRDNDAGPRVADVRQLREDDPGMWRHFDGALRGRDLGISAATQSFPLKDFDADLSGAVQVSTGTVWSWHEGGQIPEVSGAGYGTVRLVNADPGVQVSISRLVMEGDGFDVIGWKPWTVSSVQNSAMTTSFGPLDGEDSVGASVEVAITKGGELLGTASLRSEREPAWKMQQEEPPALSDEGPAFMAKNEGTIRVPDAFSLVL